MNTFLQKVRSPMSKKDDIIKQSITTSLMNVIKEIQYANVENEKSNKITDITEAANELCVVVEAMFLHGLRDTVSHKFRRVLARIDEKAQAPDFWAPLLVISHKQIINQILALSQITTEIGQCRAWIRIALNDCLLSSYLLAMKQNPSALKSYYSTNSYLRDCELLDVSQRLIEGVESFKIFTIPTNSSLLNNWQMHSLILAGIWTPTLKTAPLAACDDVASILDEDARQVVLEDKSDTASLSSAISFASQASKQGPSFTEEEVLRIIFAKDKVEPNVSSADTESNKNSVDDNINHNSIGNSLNREGWSFTPEANKGSYEEESFDEKPADESFTALVESYDIVGGDYIRTPDIRGIWQKFEDKRNDDSKLSSPSTVEEVSIAHSLSHGSLIRSDSTSMSAQVFRIAREKGLDMQNFECADCKTPLVEQGYFVCTYTGNYHCESCMSTEEVGIPARIIHNWDFKAYPVSQKSSKYLNEIKDYPVIDFKVVNPYIYAAVEEMAELQTLRNQLNFLRAYLYTCREPIIEQLQKQMWPREYMYEHIHQYSINDLHEIQSGLLAQQLQKVVKFGKDHVSNCWLCSQKGFLCEICNNPKALFPFDIESVFRCDVCNAVYHKDCLDSSKPCRKCKRRKEREELPIEDTRAE